LSRAAGKGMTRERLPDLEDSQSILEKPSLLMQIEDADISSHGLSFDAEIISGLGKEVIGLLKRLGTRRTWLRSMRNLWSI